MECNKDEAIRAKEIAEKKFDAKDFAGAKKFALKAENLYPGLQGISQMVATFNVYVCASNKTNGEADWYSMFGVTPSADVETIRKQYRKLALTLHPDKNKSVGAEGAFKIVSGAWSLLSDISKRVLYDNRRSPREFPPKPAPPPAANGFYDFSKSSYSSGKANSKPTVFSFSNPTVSSGKVDKNSSEVDTVNKSSASGATQRANLSTFWTRCPKCKSQYEYLKVYLNQQLLCPHCKQAFTGKATISGGFGDGSRAPFSQGGASKVPHATNFMQQTYEKIKREREEALAAKGQDKDIKRKHLATENSSAEYFNFANNRRGIEEANLSTMNQNPSGIGLSTSSAPLGHGFPGPFQVNRTNKLCGVRDLTQNQIRGILIEKAKGIIHKKLSEKKLNSMSKDATSSGEAGVKSEHLEVLSQEKSGASVGKKNVVSSNSVSPAVVPAAKEPDKTASESQSINVPDSDFYDFDKDRNEQSFEANQLWAAYDTDDGMPRFYAFVQSVLSRDPFKVKISWLNPKKNTEPGSMDWVDSGFTQTCGEFRITRYEVNDTLNSFSHIVSWTKGPRGVIQIFPKKGDVWALFQNWSPDWDEVTSEDVIHKYDMVEVLEDYDEEVGVAVIPLVKVDGFKSVYRQLDNSQTRRIPKEEIFRFSHQVPRHLLTDREASDTLKGCMELDPAATAMD